MEISVLILLIIIFFLHFIADFGLQTRKMAENKSHSIKYLTLHVLTYCIPFLILIVGFGWTTDFLWFMLWLFGTHWITDFITSKITAYFWKKKKIKDFFLMIGFDQFIHAVTLLILVYKFILN